jgi:signal peptidase II
MDLQRDRDPGHRPRLIAGGRRSPVRNLLSSGRPRSVHPRSLHLRSAHLRAVLVLVAVLILDQITKRIVAHAIVPGEQVGVLPGIQLVHTHNHGVAFGLAAKDQILVTALVAVALLALLAYFLTHASRPLVWLPTGLLLGGALGNLIDRIRTGSVVDFVQLPLGWPPFNLADAAIVAGVLLLLFVIEAPRHEASETTRAGRG